MFNAIIDIFFEFSTLGVRELFEIEFKSISLVLDVIPDDVVDSYQLICVQEINIVTESLSFLNCHWFRLVWIDSKIGRNLKICSRLIFLPLFVLNMLLLFGIHSLVGCKCRMWLLSLHVHGLLVRFGVFGDIVIEVSGFFGSLRGSLDIVVLISSG